VVTTRYPALAHVSVPHQKTEEAKKTAGIDYAPRTQHGAHKQRAPLRSQRTVTPCSMSNEFFKSLFEVAGRILVFLQAGRVWVGSRPWAAGRC